jgi:hypothetical protein
MNCNNKQNKKIINKVSIIDLSNSTTTSLDNVTTGQIITNMTGTPIFINHSCNTT